MPTTELKMQLEKLKELLERWLRLHNSVLSPDEMTMLYDDTQKALEWRENHQDDSSEL